MRADSKLTISAVLGIGVSIGLAIVGWGGMRPFFAHPAFIALVIVTVALAVASGFTEGNLSSGEHEDRSNRWVLAAFGVIGLLAAFVPAWTDRHGVWTIDGDVARWIGVVLYAVGGVLRIWPVFVLGRRFSGLVAIQQDHKLVTDGIYAVVRNPSYLGLLVNMVGWGLAFRSVAGLVLAASALIPLVGRMRAEERLLHEHFGAEYDRYRARTWRLIPWLY